MAVSNCQAGENSHDCAVCGKTLSSCTAGSPVIENSTAASCGQPGSYDEVVYCTVCGEKLNSTHHTVDALPHSYQETVTKAATCEEAGSKTLYCPACGDTKTEEIKALGHNEIPVAAQAPTCTAIGWDAYVKCSRCNYTTYNELPMASHDYNAVVTAPDCLNGGYTTYTCKNCPKTYTGDATEATGHKESAVVTSPDCLNGGYTTYTCTACGATRTGDETTALGHTEETVAGKAATCTEAGLTDGKKCLVCGATTVAQTVINALGHDYDVSVEDASCTEEGLKTFTCKNCPDTYKEVIDKTGHSYDNDSDFVCNNCGFDSTEFRLVNGGFENGLEGWTLVGNIGNVSSDAQYWINDPERAEGYSFGMDGSNMFSAYAPGAEERFVGTLTSSTFTVGGNCLMTFKLGAAKDGNYVYVDVVDAETKQILARYYNGLWADRTDGVKSGCTLVPYVADLSAFEGEEVFLRFSDNADSGYGLFFVDSIVTYYESAPEGFNAATPVNYTVSGTIYDVFNGGFEMGDVQGWWNIGEPGAVTGADAFFSGVAYGKDGNFLYSGVEDHGAGNGREGNKGTLTSSVFELGGSGYITYMLGGGNNLCFVQVIDAVTGEVLGRYRQQAREDGVLKKYVADLSTYVGRTVRIEVVDQAYYDWGCISFDNVVTYYESKPEGFIDAIDIKGDIVNGSFESGNLYGWTMEITKHENGDCTCNTLGWVQESERSEEWYTVNNDRKDGRNLFTFLALDGFNCEHTEGILTSSTFTLKQNSYVSFRFGAAGNENVYIQLCNANGDVIATFYNEAEGKKDTEMYAYYYQYTGETADCYFRIVDNSGSSYGCFVVDDFRVNLESAPEGFIAAIQ